MAIDFAGKAFTEYAKHSPILKNMLALQCCTYLF